MLQIGSLSTFGLTLPGLLKAEQGGYVHPAARSKKSVILVWMHGGPSQLDMYDMKPQAPAEYRGPFRPVASSLPGLDVCELLPEHAKVMDKCTVIRSFSHGNGDHWAAAHWMLTGRMGANGSDRRPRYPSMGAVASHLLGPTQPGSLPTVNMNDGGFGFHGAAWLGVNHNPFRYGDFSYGNEAGQLPTGDRVSLIACRCPASWTVSNAASTAIGSSSRSTPWVLRPWTSCSPAVSAKRLTSQKNPLRCANVTAPAGANRHSLPVV